MESYFLLSKDDNGIIQWEARCEPKGENFYYFGLGTSMEEAALSLADSMLAEIKQLRAETVFWTQIEAAAQQPRTATELED